MAKDVLITPLDGIIQFSASDGAGTGQIKVDNNDLVISNLVGDVLLGDGASDVFIGNGSDNVDIVFEQSGEIRDDGSGKTITIGSKTTTLILSSSTDLTLQGGGGNVGIGTTTAGEQLEVIGNISASGFVSASAFGGDGSALTNVSSTPPTGTISSSAQFGSSDNVQFNHITASIISASTKIHASDIRDFNNGHLTIRPDAELNLGTAATDEINIGRTSSTTCDINMFANSTDPTLRIVNKTATFNHPVTASADIRLAGNISMSAGGRIGVRPEEIGGGSDLGTTTTHNADSIQFHITDGEAVVIDNNRRVGIGNSNPSQQLNVTGNISASGHVYLEDNKGIQFGQTSENFISGSSNDIVIAAYDDIFFKGLNMGTEILHIKGGESIVELTGTLDVSSHITSSGNISATGEIKADHFLASDQDDGYHFGDSSVALQRANNSLEVKYSTVVAQFSNTIGLNLTGNITASGHISQSATSTGSFGHIRGHRVVVSDEDASGPGWPEIYVEGEILATGEITSDNGLRVRDSGTDVINLENSGHITASGNISASGTQHIFGGSVGIGTSSPAVNLHVSDTAGSNTLETIRIENSNGYGELGVQSTYVRLLADGNLTYAANNSQTLLSVGGATKATLNSSGLNVDGHITASGNISASGTMFAHTGSFTHVPTINGITTFAAAGNLDIGPYNFRARTLQSDVSTGTVPISISSTTKVTNLNADLLDDQEGSHYLDFGNFVIDDDEIPIAKLASDAITIGGAGSTALGGTATVANILKGSTVFSSSAQFQGENFNIGNMTASANISMSAGNIFVSDGAKIGYSKTQEFGDGDDTESSIRFNSANTQIIAAEKTMIHAEDGKVGIFTDTPNEVLEVKGNISASGKLIVNGGLQLGHDEVNFISASGANADTIIGSGDDIIFKGNGSDEIVRIRGDEAELLVTGDISASGEIFLDGGMTASKGLHIPSSEKLFIGDIAQGMTFENDASETVTIAQGGTTFGTFGGSGTGGELNLSGRLVAVNITASKGVKAEDLETTDDLTVGDNINMSDGGKIGDMAGAGNGDEILFDNTNRRIDTNIDGGRILSVGNGIVGINTTPVTNVELTVRGDISASGLISAKQYQTYVCSFNDDMGTTEHGLPWGSTFENAFQADETVAFVVPCKTNVKHILMRGQGFDQNLVAGLGGAPPNIKFAVKTHSPFGTAITTEGNWTTKEVATVLAPSAVDTGGKTLTYARFSGSHAQGGDAVFIGMQFSADFSNGSDEFYITVVMEHDYNSLPVTGSSQRNLITGSIADGGGFGS